MKNVTDHELIRKIAKGDSKAFESLFNKYGNLVFGVSKKLTKNQARAEDMTQQTWIKVLTESKNFSPDFASPNAVKAWIMRINRNLIIDQFRFEQRWSSVDIDEDVELADDSDSQLDSLITEEQRTQFNIAFADLDERERVVLTMSLVDEKQYAEIAKELSISVASIKTIVFRAKSKLTSLVKPKNPKHILGGSNG